MTLAVQYDVFVSYNRSDHVAVDQLAVALRACGLRLFIDRWYLEPGQPWPRLLEQHLASCNAAAIVVGPSGLGNWQRYEQYHALDRQTREPGFPVIPVLLPGVQDPPLGFLGLNTWIDLRQGLEQPDVIKALAGAIRREALFPSDRDMPDPRSEVCPYRGLYPFREEDEGFFCGRENFVTQLLLPRVSRQSVTALIGASGSGKSSVVRSGLVPALRRGADGLIWASIVLTPTRQPLHALSAALSPPAPGLSRVQRLAQIADDVTLLRQERLTIDALVRDLLAEQSGTQRLLLVIDQWEELYTQCESDADRRRFVELLLETAGEQLTLVITLRGDFYSRVLEDRLLSDRLQDAVVNLGPMRRDELRRAIEEPAAKVGLTFQEGIVERVLDEVGDEPGNLPLLEFLLTELWEQREGKSLTHRAYNEIGGVRKAITHRADQALGRLDGEQMLVARRLMIQLVVPGEGQEDTRARLPIPRDDPKAQAIARYFADARLLVTQLDPSTGRETVEVSHEALIREWQTLREWVSDNREFLRTLRRVREAMQRWMEKGQPDDLLLPSGRPLAEAQDLLGQHGDAFLDEVRPYIERSIALEHQRRETEELRARTERERQLAAERAVELARAARQRAELEQERLRSQATEEAWHTARRIAKRTRVAAVLLGVAALAALIALGLYASSKDQLAAARDEAEMRAADAVAARNAAQAARSHAMDAQKRTEREAKLAARQSKYKNEYLTFLSANETVAGQPVTGLTLALQALADKAEQSEFGISNRTAGAIALALQRNPLRLLLPGSNARFLGNGTRILTVSQNGPARIYDVATGCTQVSEAWQFENGVSRNFDVNADGKAVAIIGESYTRKGGFSVGGRFSSTAVVWQPDAAVALKVIEPGLIPILLVLDSGFGSSTLEDVSLSRDGQFLLTTSGQGYTHLYEVASGKRLASIGYHLVREENSERVLGRQRDSRPHLKRDPLRRAVFAPDGKRALALYEDTTARILSIGAASMTELASPHWASG
jgi:hypothetical protein